MKIICFEIDSAYIRKLYCLDKSLHSLPEVHEVYKLEKQIFIYFMQYPDSYLTSYVFQNILIFQLIQLTSLAPLIDIELFL